FIYGLVDVRKHAAFHEIGDDLERLLLELLGQLTHDNRRLDRNYLGVSRQDGLGRGGLNFRRSFLLTWTSGHLRSPASSRTTESTSAWPTTAAIACVGPAGKFVTARAEFTGAGRRAGRTWVLGCVGRRF